jgi:hypothetical protein
VAYDAAVGDDADTTRSVYTAKHEESGELSASSAPGRSGAYLIASHTSIEAALQSVKLFECIGQGCRDGSRFAVQPLRLDSAAPEAALRRKR